MNYNWVSLRGAFEFSGEEIKFVGERGQDSSQPQVIGLVVCDKSLADGEISAVVEFPNVRNDREMISSCHIVTAYDPVSRGFISGGIGGVNGMFEIRSFDGSQFQFLASAGDMRNLRSEVPYRLRLTTKGSIVRLAVNDVHVLEAYLPHQIPRRQVGMWCMNEGGVRIAKYSVSESLLKAFVIMQFSEHYNALTAEVIKPVCTEFGLDAVRADDSYGPGLIIADVIKQIYESTVIIADITPANRNVYYEVGYAHAAGKQTILIAERNTDLPFDLSGFRTLFYENSIGGKKRFEEGLRKHIKAILG